MVMSRLNKSSRVRALSLKKYLDTLLGRVQYPTQSLGVNNECESAVVVRCTFQNPIFSHSVRGGSEFPGTWLNETWNVPYGSHALREKYT